MDVWTRWPVPFADAGRPISLTAPRISSWKPLGQRVWSGVYKSWNDDGSISMELEDGALKKFWAGEIEF